MSTFKFDLRAFALPSLLYLLLVVAVCFPLQSFAVRDWTANDDAIIGIPSAEEMPLTYRTLDNGQYAFRFERPVLKRELVQANGSAWTLLSIDGETKRWEIGKPSLPLVVRSILLPNKGNIEVKIVSSKFEEFNNIDVLPQQPMTLDKVPFVTDEKIYRTDQWFPENIVEICPPAIMRDARVAPLAYSPVQYNPVTRKLRIYTEVNVEIIPSGGQGINELTSLPRPAPSFASLYRNIIGADELTEINQQATPGQILMIARNQTTVTTALNYLIEWKKLSGHPTQLVTVDANATADQIHQIIATAYASYNPPLEYVILVGEGGTTGTMLPSYFQYTEWSDHPYMEIVGNDRLADVCVSRFSFSQMTELQTMVNRSVIYEKTPPTTDTTWFTKGWGYAGYSHDVYSIPPAIRFCISMMNQRGINTVPYDEHNGRVDAGLISTRLSPGATFWAHRPAWIGEILPADFQNLNNVGKPFVAFNLTCESGAWYGETVTGVHEALTRLGTPSQPKGAIAAMATETSHTHPSPNNCVITGGFQALGINNAIHPSEMYLAGKYQLWRNFSAYSPAVVDSFSSWNNIMGDASTIMWTAAPRTLLAVMPQQLGIGDNRFGVSVTVRGNPAPNALVTAWKRNGSGVNETYTSVRTDELGNALLTLTNATAGNMYVSVTSGESGLNYKAFLDTVVIAQATADLALSSVTVNDTPGGGIIGNSDTQANPGETVELQIRLTNVSATSVTGISGTLLSLDSRIAVVSNTASWQDLASGASIVNTGSLRVQMHPALHDNEIIPLRLNVNSTEGSLSLTVPLLIRSLASAFVSDTTIGSARLNPGATAQLAVTLKNNGGLALSTPTTATLTSLNRFVTVGSATASFSSIPSNGIFSNLGGVTWTVSASSAAVPGTQASFQIVLANGAVRDTLFFTKTIGTVRTVDPTGPDGYGYRVFDDTDTEYNQMPTYQWVELRPDLGGSGTRLNIPDIQVEHDTSLVIRLPFTIQFYGIRYDTLSVCSNGWAAFGNQPLYNNFRNWRLPANEGPRNILAIMWDDLSFDTTQHQGVYYYYDNANHRLILTWWARTNTADLDPNEFQMILYDQQYWRTPTNDAPIVYQYKTLNNVNEFDPLEPNYGTIGIADANYRNALEYSYYGRFSTGSSTLANGTNVNRAIKFTTCYADSMLHLIAPTSTDSLLIGYPAQILWSGRPTLGTINIEIDRNYPSGTWEPILTGTPNDGFELWTVTGTATNNARFRILSTNSTDGDTSLKSITMMMPQPFLDLSVPNGGELWTETTEQLILWNHPPMIGTAKIELNREYPSGNWETIVDSIDVNSGVYGWTVSGPSTTSGRVRISSNAFVGVGDTSNSEFGIVSPSHLSFSPSPNIIHLFPADTFRQSVSLSNSGGSAFTGTLTPTLGIEGYGYLENGDPGGPTYRWVEISEEGDWMEWGDDNVSDVINLPFTFPFYGEQFTTAYMCTNGWVSFSDPDGIGSHMNRVLPYFEFGAFVPVYWDHVIVPEGGNIYYSDTINHRAIFEWKNCWVARDTTARLTFELIIYPNGTIDYVYSQLSVGRADQTIGLQGPGATPVFNIYQHQQITTPHIIRFSNMHAWGTPSTTTLSVPAGGIQYLSILWDSHGFALNNVLNGSVTIAGFADNTPYVIPMTMNLDGNAVGDDPVALPTTTKLLQNYPNPFNPETEIRFQLNQTNEVRLVVFDILGQPVQTLVNRSLTPGEHRYRFDGSKVAAGVYFYRLQAGNFTQTRKMVLVK